VRAAVGGAEDLAVLRRDEHAIPIDGPHPKERARRADFHPLPGLSAISRVHQNTRRG